jgi:type I restriction enzyme S subunit
MNVLNLGMIKKLKLPVPPISRQKEYLNFVAQVDKSRFGGMLHLLNSLSGIMHASFFSVADTD